jgi:hypothetical protein
MGSTKYCSKPDPFLRMDSIAHPDILHKMEMTLGNDANSDDSATAEWASSFMVKFETEFNAYHPDKGICNKLKSKLGGVEIKVIGGNWCSDTRREVPRLCKILHYCQFPVQNYSYFRVDRKKKAVENDFAATTKFTSVPAILVLKNGKELGRIEESPKKSIEKDLLRIL